jgi:anti-sigma factor RsiW
MADLRLDTSLEHEEREERLQSLLAKQAEIQAQIASLLPYPSTQHHRTPIHKQHQQRRSNVPRSMSSSGTITMARAPSVRQSFSPTPNLSNES